MLTCRLKYADLIFKKQYAELLFKPAHTMLMCCFQQSAVQSNMLISCSKHYDDMLFKTLC
jgi:hypothetical protein